MLIQLPEAFQENLKAQHEDLFAEHRARTADNHYVVGTNVFFEGGLVRSTSLVKFHGGGSKLDPELYPKHIEWYEQYQADQYDRQKVTQTLRSIIMRAQSWQDVRDMLPENVIQSIRGWEQVTELQRTRPDLYAGPKSRPEYEIDLAARVMHWDPMLLSMYERIGNTIATYVGYKML